jgi:hypothetical protein
MPWPEICPMDARMKFVGAVSGRRHYERVVRRIWREPQGRLQVAGALCGCLSPPSEMDLEGHRPCPSPWTEAVYFLDLAARASKKVEHWRARLCGKQRKSTASVQGEG